MPAKPGVPAEIQVGPYRVAVVVDAGEMAKVGVKQRSELLGHFDERSSRIVLDPEQADDTMADTLLHEVAHALWCFSGLSRRKVSDISDEDDLQEAVVSAMSTLLLDTLRRNPALVAYLTA